MMRWLFVDRIESFHAWESITAYKTISFEEFHLLEDQGRKGEFPESLLLEACVEMFRWLIIRSSDYRLSAVLQSIDEFSWNTSAGCGDVLHMTLAIEQRMSHCVSATVTVLCQRGKLADGHIVMETLNLDTYMDRSLLRGAWKELYGAA